MVAILRPRNIDGALQLVPVGNTVMSDDRGEFRLFGISPGEYYLSADAGNRVVGPPPDTGEPPTYATTYFPRHQRPGRGAAPVDRYRRDDQRCDRRFGAHTQGADQRERPSIRRAGRWQVGSFCCRVVAVLSASRGSPGSPIGPDGSFTIERVTAGTYDAGGKWAESRNGPVPRSWWETGISRASRLIGTKAVTATGRVIVDSVAAPLMRPGTIEVVAAHDRTSRHQVRRGGETGASQRGFDVRAQSVARQDTADRGRTHRQAGPCDRFAIEAST